MVNALQKDGSIGNSTPLDLRDEGMTSFVDIKANRTHNGQSEQIIVAEVKCFIVEAEIKMLVINLDEGKIVQWAR